MPKGTTLISIGVATFAFTGVAIAQSGSDPPATLCAKKADGTLRLTRNGKCKRTETRLRVNQVVTVRGPAGSPGPPGPAGTPGATGAPGRDANPADYADEPTTPVAVAPAQANQCSLPAQFCTGGNNWHWRNYGNGYQSVGFWKDRSGVVHLEGVAELFGGSAGSQPAAFILPPAYRPAATRQFPIRAAADTLRYVDVYPDGRVTPQLGGAGIAPLDGIAFRP
ncbi:MAG: hypothetical protein ACTHMY_22875 [Solirubrobacteraceae bacterium]